jgi:hypothetical protein
MFCRVADPEDGAFYEGMIEENPSTDGLLVVAVLGCEKKLRAECSKLRCSAGLAARMNQIERGGKVSIVGDACQVIYPAENRPYRAHNTDICGDSVTVKYDEYDDEAKYSLRDLQEVSRWNVNDQCRALYSDGNTYKAVVKKINDDETAVVVFEGYVDEEIVKVADLTPWDGPADAADGNAGK